MSYDDEENVIRIANDCIRLASNLMSASLQHALSVRRRLRAGFIGRNRGVGFDAAASFGGYKDSGGSRQDGDARFDQYTDIRSVAHSIAQRKL